MASLEKSDMSDCRLCGTKLGCGEGGCGACTVMVSRMDRTRSSLDHLSVNACLAPVVSMHGEIIRVIINLKPGIMRSRNIKNCNAYFLLRIMIEYFP